MSLPIDKMIKEKGFIFVWSGSEHLDDTRLLFKKWGLKWCEEIVWIKSNNKLGWKANDSI